MNVQVQSGSENPSGTKLKGWLVGAIGVLVLVPSLINAGSDVWRSLMNSPIGTIEKQNVELMKAHWDEPAVFSQDVEIKNDAVTRVLRFKIYQNADIWVRYGKEERWLASLESEEFAALTFSLISSAIAQDKVRQTSKEQSFSTLKSQLDPVVIDLNQIRLDKENISLEKESEIQKSYVFSETNNSHRGFKSNSRKFTQTYKAEEGYVFTDAKLDVISRTNAGEPEISISDDKKSVTVEVDIRSGPMFNRWRGWTKADVFTHQELEEKVE